MGATCLAARQVAPMGQAQSGLDREPPGLDREPPGLDREPPGKKYAGPFRGHWAVEIFRGSRSWGNMFPPYPICVKLWSFEFCIFRGDRP